MMDLSPMEALTNRIGLPDVAQLLKERGITKVAELRSYSREKLEDIIPNEEARNKLLKLIMNRGTQQGGSLLEISPQEETIPHRGALEPEAARGFRDENNWNSAPHGRRGHHNANPGSYHTGKKPPIICRRFQRGGCQFGANCRNLHVTESIDIPIQQHEYHHNNQVPAEGLQAENTDPYCYVNLSTPCFYWLMNNFPHLIDEINTRCKTWSEISASYRKGKKAVVLIVKGPTKDAITDASDSIGKLVYSYGYLKDIARCRYLLNELEVNQHTAKIFAMANLANEGTEKMLSPSLVRRVISTFRFVEPPNIRHLVFPADFSVMSRGTVLRQYIFSKLKACQAIIFGDLQWVENQETKTEFSPDTFPSGVVPIVVHPKLSKEERLSRLDQFFNGVVDKNTGMVHRLLITTDDYAKFAYKNAIAFVNVVIQVSVPRFGENYALRSLVSAHPNIMGISLTFLDKNDRTTYKYLSGINVEIFTMELFEKVIEDLTYDTVEHPLTVKSEMGSQDSEMLE